MLNKVVTIGRFVKGPELRSIVGRLQIRSYEDSEGVSRKAAEIIADDVRFLNRVVDHKGSV